MAYAYPIQDEGEAKVYLDRLRQQHPKANHHCYAWRLGLDRSVFRVNDDGEPNGSAGRPMLNMIYARDLPDNPLTNLLVVVVRYFGGTLLGVPGLINAYKMATNAALDQAKIIDGVLTDTLRISFAFEQMNDVMRVVKEQGLTVLKQDFDTACVLVISVRKTLTNSALNRFGGLRDVEVKVV
ncbi:IMPACT family protein [Fibrella rubiginis]|uniref:IMPACT family protein n=1 Tax=Fibrella rubiginis TaxID=2817060 RepID=UPI001E303A36|nr:YigZ family protein [Fibrella rubiginis]